jgi:glutathionylspermidine synthase
MWHTDETGAPYWNESAAYAFTSDEVDIVEEATNTLHRLCLDAVEYVIANNRFADLGIPNLAIPLIKRSWQDRAPSLYGRFDLAYDGVNPPKMLEYNADTPTSLLEAAVVQWYWLQAVRPHSDQFNSLWESMTARWTELKAGHLLPGQTVYMTYSGDDLAEDHMTVACVMQETAKEAGIITQAIPIGDIGWDNDNNVFVDARDKPMHAVFKLYPWEWMYTDTYGVCLNRGYDATRWIEPHWKLILSSKGILPILWEMAPNHPNLLEAHLNDPGGLADFAKKPVFSREGANVVIAENGRVVTESVGTYASDQNVYQALYRIPSFNSRYPVLGSWIIGDEAHGMGIRESSSLITDNQSQFVPHFFE